MIEIILDIIGLIVLGSVAAFVVSSCIWLIINMWKADF
jgi:hypothetical protein